MVELETCLGEVDGEGGGFCHHRRERGQQDLLLQRGFLHLTTILTHYGQDRHKYCIFCPIKTLDDAISNISKN